MSCKVWIWNYVGSKSAFGHAAMSIYGGEPSGTYYVSWWPNCQSDGSGGSGWDGKKREYFGLCEPSRSRKFAKDMEDEFGKWPDRSVVLAGLDETAMKKFWTDLTSDPRARWSATTTNCAAAVAAALNAGGSGSYFGFLEETMFYALETNWWSWTPESVHAYAVKLQQKLREAGKLP